MSINPVTGTSFITDAQATHHPPSQVAGRTVREPAQPDPGTSPKQETRTPQEAPESSEMPQDAVEVHRDNETTEIVIRYLDRSGSVILQVPSSEVLNVARSIAMDFQKQAKDRAATCGTAAASEGGEIHGY